VVTNRQTDRQTNAGDYIIPRESFRGDNNISGLTEYVAEKHGVAKHAFLN